MKLEVPAELEPDQAMPLDAIPAKEVMEVLAYKVTSNSPVLTLKWQQLAITLPVQYLGLIRDGEWLQAAEDPAIANGDTIMVLAPLKHVKKLSEVLASDADKSILDNSNFFGDFVLNGNISLRDLDAFYTIDFKDQEQSISLADYITQKFHRRVVVGDQVRLDQLLLTVRQIDDKGQIQQVGIKPVSA